MQSDLSLLEGLGLFVFPWVPALHGKHLYVFQILHSKCKEKGDAEIPFQPKPSLAQEAQQPAQLEHPSATEAPPSKNQVCIPTRKLPILLGMLFACVL